MNKLKEDIPKWTLDSDKKLTKAIEASADQMFNGISELIGACKELDKNAEECLIRLKHALNWVSSLSSTKFIENNIQPGKSEPPPQPPPPAVVAPPKDAEQILAKYRKAIEIAINDLNLKDLKADEFMTVTDVEDADKATMTAGGNFVTPQLRGKLPFLIGSKEFYAVDFMGIEIGDRLTINTLKILEEEQKKKEKLAQPANANQPVVSEPVLNVSQNPAPVIEKKEVIKEKVPPPPKPIVEERKPEATVKSVLDSYSGQSTLFGLGKDQEGEDEELPMFKKDSPKKEPEIPPPAKQAENLAPAMALKAEEKKAENPSNPPSLFEEGPKNFTELRNSSVVVKEDKHQNLKNKLNSIFDDEPDEDVNDKRKTARQISALYNKPPPPKVEEKPIVVAAKTEPPLPEPALPLPAPVPPPLSVEPLKNEDHKLEPPPTSVDLPLPPKPQQPQPQPQSLSQAVPISTEKKEEVKKKLLKMFTEDDEEDDIGFTHKSDGS